ncbi:hypothetical protein ARMGADRAFT_525573 [Armillaria gallica]|uniref:Uncharacterized protein n=1 Tax=Armillaria gallica TaxID=47427 RepID=A0A2H3DXP7_ARMGA|nr:hypothetical protein ARMGADRAFT_525573 [Armillaria gallica]
MHIYLPPDITAVPLIFSRGNRVLSFSLQGAYVRRQMPASKHTSALNVVFFSARQINHGDLTYIFPQ